MPMSDKKRWIRLAVAAGLGAAAGAWTYQIQKDKKAKNNYTCGASDFTYGQLGNLGKSVGRNKPFNSNI